MKTELEKTERANVLKKILRDHYLKAEWGMMILLCDSELENNHDLRQIDKDNLVWHRNEAKKHQAEGLKL